MQEQLWRYTEYFETLLLEVFQISEWWDYQGGKRGRQPNAPASSVAKWKRRRKDQCCSCRSDNLFRMSKWSVPCTRTTVITTL